MATAVALALTLNTTQAAIILAIDLDSPCEPAPSECVIPPGGIVLHDFITLSSPDGAVIINPNDDTPLNAGLGLFEGKTAEFAFDDTKALVSNITFLGSTGAGDLTYTVFETEADFDSVTESDTDFTAMITGYESIIKLRLDNAVEGSARQFIIEYTAIPLPAAVWLFGSGLLGLAGISLRKQH
jgi:hypothetical protein